MSHRFNKLFLLTVSVALLLGPSTPASSPKTCSAQKDQPTSVAKAPYEVRLRKLHLVRPDLIPFPINFDVYC